MDNLPVEIYYRILGHLSKRDIFSVSLVCNRVHGVANELHNKTWIVNDRKVTITSLNTIRLKDDVYFKNRHFVRKLIFTSYWDGKVGFFPRGVIATSRKRETHPILTQANLFALLDSLPYIEEIDLSESGSLVHSYINFLSFANLPRIKKITVQTRDFGTPFMSFYTIIYRRYFFTCFKFRGTLTSLYYQHENDLNKLSQFKNLAQLEFSIQHGDGMIMFQILKLLPQLIDFKFNTTPIDSQRVTRRLLEQSIEPIEKSNKSLQYLEISLPSLSIDYTKCLNIYLAEGLHTLDRRSWDRKCFKTYEKSRPSKEGSICFFQNDETQRTNFLNEVRITRWLRLANAFNENKKAPCAVIFGYDLQGTCEFSSSNKQLILRYEEKRADTIIETVSLYNFITLFSEFSLPSGSISTIGPKTIYHLELTLKRRNSDDTQKSLKYVFTNFINLQYFRLVGYLLIRGYKNQKECKPHGIQNNMTRVDFSGLALAPGILDTISTYLPNIDTLNIENLGYFRDIMDITTFKNLKRCHFIPQLTFSKLNAFINFKYLDGTEKLYYYDNRKQGYSRVWPTQNDYSPSDQYSTFICNNDTEVAICLDRSCFYIKADEYHGHHFDVSRYHP